MKTTKTIIASFAAILAASAWAADTRWTANGADTNWSTVENWSGNAIPPSSYYVGLEDGNVNSSVTDFTITIDGNYSLSHHLWNNYSRGAVTLAKPADSSDSSLYLGDQGLWIGDGSNKESTLVIDGPAITAAELHMSKGGTGTLTIKNGSLTVTGDSYVGINSGKTGEVVLEGGLLAVKNFKASSGTAKLTINGGTLKVNAANADFIPSAAIVSIGENGGTIDTAYNVTIAADISGSAALVKQGDGVLTISGAFSNADGVIVSNGTVVVSSTGSVSNGITLDGGYYKITASDTSITASPAITVNGGKLIVDVSSLELTESSTLALSGVTLGTGVSAADVIVIAGAELDWTPTVGESSITFAAVEATGANEWVGLGSDTKWGTAANWKYGVVPTSTQTVTFPFDCTVILAANASAAALVVNANVTFTDVGGADWKYIQLNGAGGVTGSGTVTLAWAGLYNDSGSDIAFDVPLTIAASTHGSWLGTTSGSSTKKWTLTGDVACNAEFILEAPMAFQSKVTGSGTIKTATTGGNYGAVVFNGDFSEFTGTMNIEKAAAIANANQSNENMTWNLKADLTLGSAVGSAGASADFTGTVKFGTLNTSNTATMKVNTGVSGVVLEVGSGSMGNSYFLCGQDFATGNNNDVVTKDVTLKKVGTGKLTYAGFGFPKIEVSEGELVFAAPNTSLNHYAHTYTTIDSLTVASGAAISGTGERTITSVSLASGAILRQTVTTTTTTENEVTTTTATCPTLTINGTVNMDGAIATLVDSSDNYLSNAVSTDETVFTLLTATSVTGTPAGTPVAMATNKWSWWPKVRGGTEVVMKARANNPGLILIIR